MLIVGLSLIFQQLTDSLLEMEEEKAIWSAKEKASIETIEAKTNVNKMEIASVSKALVEVSY